MIDNKEKYNAGNVKDDAEIARPAEEKAIRILELAFPNAEIENLHDKREFWHKGDIELAFPSMTIYGDVKDESVIHRTGNVFCENHKYFYTDKETRSIDVTQKSDGWMKASDYDVVIILDDIDKNIYLINFKKLKEFYENWSLKPAWLSDAKAWGNCVPLHTCQSRGALLWHIRYEEKEDGNINLKGMKHGRLLEPLAK